jgi:CheY-like chemotaxis protein
MARICKVLIVENDDDVRDLLGDILRDEGYLFATVKAGAECARRSTATTTMSRSST